MNVLYKLEKATVADVLGEPESTLVRVALIRLRIFCDWFAIRANCVRIVGTTRKSDGEHKAFRGHLLLLTGTPKSLSLLNFSAHL
jgi:hypothetical protein